MFFSLKISTNGVISFNHSFDLYYENNVDFPKTTPPYVPLIAPFWSDFNFRDSGALFYRNRTDTEDPTLLQLVADRIGISEFSPSLAVVVTWFQSQLLGSRAVVSSSCTDRLLLCFGVSSM